MRTITKSQYRAFTFEIKEALKKLMQDDRGSRLFLLRLTIKNVSGDNLSASLAHFNEAFPRFLKLSGLDKLAIAYVKGVFSSYNKERQDYHVYIESLVLLPSSYFDNKISNERLSEFWKKALRISYIPIVSLVPVRKGDGSYLDTCLEEIDKLLQRLDKIKNYSDDTQKQALSGRKLLTLGGKLK